MARKFYRTTVSIDILSEEPIEDFDTLQSLGFEIEQGDSVGGDMRFDRKVLTAKEAATALYEMGSEPAFFMLTDDGEEMDE